MGAIEQNIAKQAARAGKPMPDKIANSPELESGLDLYLDAFFDLNSERSDGPISWSSIANYSRFYEFDEEQTETMFFHIRELDGVYLQRMSKKAES